MKSIKDFLNEELNIITESYINIIGNDNEAITKKKKYVDNVWDMLQKSYAKIGGIKGSGFNSKEDMIKNIPFWKIRTKDGIIRTIVMYKDKDGRKSVAMGTDGEKESTNMLITDIKDEFSRSWGEKSGALLWVVYKNLNDIFDKYVIDINKVKQLLPDDEIIPYTEYNGELDSMDKDLISKIDQKYHKYFYLREFGGSKHLKMALGTPNKKII